MAVSKQSDIEISVIIPTYNRSAFLLEAIQSVLDQDYWEGSEHWEFVVVDDGSTDDTAEAIRPYGDRIAYVKQPHSGVSAARNLGLRLIRGEFVAFLDSDDLWKPGKITSQMLFMREHSEAVVVCTEETWIRNGVFVNPRSKHRKYSGRVFERFLPLCLLSLSSALFRTSVFAEIGGFDESLPACEDYDLGIRLAHRYSVHTLPEALIVKRGGHADQLSRKYWGMDRFRVTALEKALALDLTPEQNQQVKAELARKCRILIGGFHKRGKASEAEPYEELLLRHGPGPGSAPTPANSHGGSE